MKKLFKSTKISLALALFATYVVQAATPGAIVSQVSGNAFMMSNGQTKTLKLGDRIDDFSDVVTEVGAQVTLTDYHDHKFHVSGSGHVKLERNQLTLERGYVWVQSFNQKDEFILKTANTKIDYSVGEAIVSFDAFSGKTQLMSIRGDFSLANALETHLKVNVGDGQFSFVSNDYNQGIPRSPMTIGESSFKKITGLFEGVQPSSVNLFPTRMATSTTAPTTAGRNIASAPEKKSSVIIIKKNSSFVNAAVISKAYQQEEEKVAAIKRKQYLKREFATKSGVAVHIYGQKKTTPVTTTTAQRMPASAAPAVIEDSKFEGSLVKQYEGQMRHSNEVNQLIDELKNYEQDYQSEY